MEADDKIRAEKGVVVCLRDMGDGTSQIFIDDVSGNKIGNPITWQHDNFYTYTPPINNEDMDEMNLSSEQLQDIGVSVVARLLALSGRTK